MIVVTDTSVILNLCLLGLPQVLPSIFGKVYAPPAVRDEFIRLANNDPRFLSLEFPSFIEIKAPIAIHSLLPHSRLHRGECEALSLAAEMNASRVLHRRKSRSQRSSNAWTALHRSPWNPDRSSEMQPDRPTCSLVGQTTNRGKILVLSDTKDSSAPTGR